MALIEERGEMAHALFAIAERVKQPQARGMRHGAQYSDRFLVPV
jgi:hypothetical protein